MLEYNDLIGALAAAANLPDLRADEDGFCVLKADTIPLSIIHLPEAGIVYISAEIGDSPTVNPDVFYATMLEANCRFEGTAGGTLARSPESGKLMLTRYARLGELSTEGFVGIVSGLLGAAELWQKLLEAHESNDTAAAPGGTEVGTPTTEAAPLPADDGLSPLTFMRI